MTKSPNERIAYAEKEAQLGKFAGYEREIIALMVWTDIPPDKARILAKLCTSVYSNSHEFYHSVQMMEVKRADSLAMAEWERQDKHLG